MLLNLTIEGLRILLLISASVAFVRGLKGLMEFVSARLLAISFYENWPRTQHEDPMLAERYQQFNSYLVMYPELTAKAMKTTLISAIWFVTSMALFYVVGVVHAVL